MGWLDPLFFKNYNTVQSDGVAVPVQPALNFVGATVEDDPTNGRTNVTIDGSGTVSVVELSCVYSAADHSTSGHLDFDFPDSLPATADIVGVQREVIVAFDGGALSAAVCTVGSYDDGLSNTLMGSVDVISAEGGPATAIGSNPYFARGGQDLFVRVSLTGATTGQLTAGEILVRVLYLTTE